jgi:hypothetical protein
VSVVDAFGWFSSGLIIISLMQARVLRFRVLNLAGAGLATIVNALLGVWPFAAMNLVITVIDIYWVMRLLRQRHDEASYEVLEVGVSDAYLRHVLAVNAKDVAATHPRFPLAEFRSRPVELSAPDAAAQDAAAQPSARDSAARDSGARDSGAPVRSAFLVLRGDETVGVVVVRDAGGGVAEVELDYVTPRVRDFTPGEFVYRRSGIFAVRGFTTLVAPATTSGHDYYPNVGFHRVADHWEREVQPSAA